MHSRNIREALALVAVATVVVLTMPLKVAAQSLHGTGARQVPASVEQGDPTLQETLEKDLRARRPEEFAFIQRVIDEMKAGRLPESLIRKTHLWARRKPQRPFQYFERAMILQARELGVDLN